MRLAAAVGPGVAKQSARQLAERLTIAGDQGPGLGQGWLRHDRTVLARRPQPKLSSGRVHLDLGSTATEGKGATRRKRPFGIGNDAPIVRQSLVGVVEHAAEGPVGIEVDARDGNLL